MFIYQRVTHRKFPVSQKNTQLLTSGRLSCDSGEAATGEDALHADDGRQPQGTATVPEIRKRNYKLSVTYNHMYLYIYIYIYINTHNSKPFRTGKGLKN